MNRHARRSDMRMFRRSDLLTHCIEADVPLDDHPLLKNALENWRGGRGTRKLICVACKRAFDDENARAGAFLFAQPVNIDGLVSTSVFCEQCWQTLSISEVDSISTRVLRQLSPGGRFIDAR